MKLLVATFCSTMSLNLLYSRQACSVIGLTVDGKKLADPKRFTAAELRTQRSLISTTIKGAVIEKLSVTLEL